MTQTTITYRAHISSHKTKPTHTTGPNFLPAGEAPLPALYFLFFFCYALALASWALTLRRRRQHVRCVLVLCLCVGVDPDWSSLIPQKTSTKQKGLGVVVYKSTRIGQA